MIIVKQLTLGRYGQAPTFIVECPKCGYKYRVTSWRKQIEKQENCWPCGRIKSGQKRTIHGKYVNERVLRNMRKSQNAQPNQ